MIHQNLKLLSHSGNTTLHTCPRKYELLRLSGEREGDDRHTIFGKCAGAAVEHMLTGASKKAAYWTAFTTWKTDLLSEDGARDGKTFWDVLIALDKFVPVFTNNLQHYRIVSFHGKPATELGFQLTLLNGFVYRGFIDAVLLDTRTSELVVFELKTTKFNKVDEAIYKNSGQALGYSLILDAIADSLGMEITSSYKVLYVIYKTLQREYELMPFTKNHLHRAVWLKQLIVDTQLIELYDKFEMFPMHGESCYSFFRQCKYFRVCELSTENLIKVVDKVEDESVYQFKFTLDQLIESQLEKGRTAHETITATATT